MSGDKERIPSGRRRRALDAEERALWQHVTRSIRRMRPAPAEEAALAAPPPEPAPTAPAAAKAIPLAAAKPPEPPRPPPLSPIEPKLRRRLSRGEPVDARLDLHGSTQAVAHRRLHVFLIGAQAAGHVLVLVITGKGATEGGPVLSGEGGRGVLRRLVPEWLASPELRPVVVGFETAARGHGGEGALYVRIRRRRDGPGGRR